MYAYVCVHTHTRLHACCASLKFQRNHSEKKEKKKINKNTNKNSQRLFRVFFMFYDFPCTFSARVCASVFVSVCVLLSVYILPAHFCMQRPQLLAAQVPLPLAMPIPLRHFSFFFPGLAGLLASLFVLCLFAYFIYICAEFMCAIVFMACTHFSICLQIRLWFGFHPPLPHPTTFLFFAIRIPIFIPISIWPTWSEIQGWTGSRIRILVEGVWEVCVSECATCVFVGAAFSCGTWLQIMAHGATGGERRVGVQARLVVSIISPILTSVSLSLSLSLSVYLSRCVCVAT